MRPPEMFLSYWMEDLPVSGVVIVKGKFIRRALAVAAPLAPSVKTE
jgi:hypothetical protein